MRSIHLVTWLLVIIGAVNWGLVGAFNLNLVTTLFGSVPALVQAVYIIVGLAGIYELLVLLNIIKHD